nr:DUF3363 domain-containing protein [Bradyrhizobium manausense]
MLADPARLRHPVTLNRWRSTGQSQRSGPDRAFVLVPWRPVLEQARGQRVTGQVGGEGICWSIGIKHGIGR